MTDEEKVEAVTAALTNKFYVGQRVRISDKFPALEIRGHVGTIIEMNKRGYAHVDGVHVQWWNPLWLELV